MSIGVFKAACKPLQAALLFAVCDFKLTISILKPCQQALSLLACVYVPLNLGGI